MKWISGKYSDTTKISVVAIKVNDGFYMFKKYKA